jgi:hypothetical protein
LNSSRRVIRLYWLAEGISFWNLMIADKNHAFVPENPNNSRENVCLQPTNRFEPVYDVSTYAFQTFQTDSEICLRFCHRSCLVCLFK